MNFFSEKNLTNWIVILPILGIVITAFIFVVSGINNRKISLKKEIHTSQIKLLKKHKQAAQKRVEDLVAYLDSSEKVLKKESKEVTKNIVSIAVAMIENTYKSHSDLPKQEILSKIKSRLNDIRFWDGAGYFFIYDLDGNCLLLPPNPSLENTNLIDLIDAKNRFTIKEHIKIVIEKGEGFDEWHWYKPNETSMKKKIGFVKIFEPLGIYIGTARYEEDLLHEIKENMKKNFLQDYLQENEKYFFIYDKAGNSIIQDNKTMKMTDVAEIVKGSQYATEGFFLNHTISVYFEVEKELKSGSSFVTYMPKYEWIIGTNTYRDEVLNDIVKNKKKVKSNFNDLIKNRILFALIMVLLMLFVSTYFANKLKSVFKRYKKDLQDEHNLTLNEQEKLRHNLKHDYLTSLPNRLLLTDRLNQAIKHSSRDKRQLAIIFIDVDKFKIINDSLGHDVGDTLLKEIAKRLTSSMRESDTVSRFGGDEFVILVDGFKNIHDIITVINKMEKSFSKDILLDNIAHNVTLSMGISVFPDDGNSAQLLLKNADIAMYKAKLEGGNRYRFFTAKMNEETQKQIEIEKELHVGVKNGEFVLYYQPLVEAKSGKISGVEALIRWNHPTKGLVFPDEFIEIAEESNVIIDMGNWIIEESMRQIVQWKEKGYELKKISINIAGKQLEHPDFIKYIKETLQKTNCKPEWIEVEIVERFAMKDVQKSIEILNELRKINIDIAIDDFGTGYSSLAYLKHLPITKLKIDRTFVKNILNSHKDRAIAESILALGSGLHLKILAEGVENEDERDFFQFNGCDEIQGYLFSKPLPAKEVEIHLKRGSF